MSVLQVQHDRSVQNQDDADREQEMRYQMQSSVVKQEVEMIGVQEWLEMFGFRVPSVLEKATNVIQDANDDDPELSAFGLTISQQLVTFQRLAHGYVTFDTHQHVCPHGRCPRHDSDRIHVQDGAGVQVFQICTFQYHV